MSHTPAEVAAAIINTLKTTAPGLSCELGTPERKIIDACSEAISEAYIDQYIVGSLLDIETKSGLELEQFVGIFGYGRLMGRQATGVVRVELTTVSPKDIDIPKGTQFYTKTGISGTATPLYFPSTQDVVLVSGTYSCDVPVECQDTGTKGNIPPDSITYLGTIIGASSVSNLTAMTGGVDVETDEELRQRFKDTLLRNVAGTADWYKAICLQNKKVNKVQVYGPTTTYRTQISAPATSDTLSVTDDVKYVWPKMESVFINLGKETETFYRAYDDYIMGSGPGAPGFQRVGTGQIQTGDIIDVEFQYTTSCSRNDPNSGITNKVDIFIDGVDPYTVTEKTVVSADTLGVNAGNFERVGSAGVPSSTNRFMRLGSVPVVSFPSTITVGPMVYTMGTHYYLLKDTTLTAGSKYETSGIEWEPDGPTDGTELTLNYIYNRAPELLTAVINSGKQITTDVMVHQADYQYLVPCLTVEYDRSYDIATVNSAINNRLQNYFQTMGFGSWVLMSNMCLAVQQVFGVANVYLTPYAESDHTHYGVMVYDNSDDPLPSGAPEAADFKLKDSVLPKFLRTVITRRATR